MMFTPTSSPSDMSSASSFTPASSASASSSVKPSSAIFAMDSSTTARKASASEAFTPVAQKYTFGTPQRSMYTLPLAMGSLSFRSVLYAPLSAFAMVVNRSSASKSSSEAPSQRKP